MIFERKLQKLIKRSQSYVADVFVDLQPKIIFSGPENIWKEACNA